MENIGKKFGERVVISKAKTRFYVYRNHGRVVGSKDDRYLCRCACGFESEVFLRSLKRGDANRCPQCARLKRRSKVSLGSMFGTKKVTSNGVVKEGKVFYAWECISCDNTGTSTAHKLGTHQECIKCILSSVKAKRDFIKNKSVKDVKIGAIFGEWIVINKALTPGGRISKALVICKCSCGHIKEVQVAHLVRGMTTSCKKCSRGKYVQKTIEPFSDSYEEKKSIYIKSPECPGHVVNAKETSNLFDLVSDCLMPKKDGKYSICICPFCGSEGKRSFRILESENIYCCFECGVAGDSSDIAKN